MPDPLDRTQQLNSRTTRYPCDPRCARTTTSCSQSTGSPLRLPAGSSQARGRSLRTDQGVHCFSESALVRTALLCPSSLALPIPKLWRIPRPPHVPSSARTQEPQRLPFAPLKNLRSSPPPLAFDEFKRALCPPAGVLLSLASLCLRHEGGATSPYYSAPSGWGSSDTAASAPSLPHTTIRARVQEKRSPHADRMHFRRLLRSCMTMTQLADTRACCIHCGAHEYKMVLSL